ncbi:unnamed protein product [Polarella glacialis]|uniref:Uncharacterized protein n=1 Tax=Polarella glacialis TaxID=89957 RepID=A0A813EPE1_POLGL|nr:unnamed protein product [Polarella glacialis]CAE8603005.1 unnamed protein product [Polarella glacialis]
MATSHLKARKCRLVARASILVAALLASVFGQFCLGVCFGSPVPGGGGGAGGEEGKAAPRPQHAQAAVAQMSQMEMPEAPADPLDWSVDEVRAASFMASASYAGSLCAALEAGKSGEEYSVRLAAMLAHSDGARGFFVTYLTEPSLETLADSPSGLSPLVVEALRGVDTTVITSLAIMNVAMPTATALAHEANGDLELAQNSARTARRGSRVLQVLANDQSTGPATRSELDACRAAAAAWPETAAGDTQWRPFFKRWRYGENQLRAIGEALDQVLGTTVS